MPAPLLLLPTTPWLSSHLRFTRMETENNRLRIDNSSFQPNSCLRSETSRDENKRSWRWENACPLAAIYSVSMAPGKILRKRSCKPGFCLSEVVAASLTKFEWLCAAVCLIASTRWDTLIHTSFDRAMDMLQQGICCPSC